jgi:hypothetical protein
MRALSSRAAVSLNIWQQPIEPPVSRTGRYAIVAGFRPDNAGRPRAHHVAPIRGDPSEELFMSVARFVSRSSTCAGRALVHTAPRWAVL